MLPKPGWLGAGLAEKEGDHQAAEEHYKAAMQVDAEEPDPYLYLGQFYERRERAEVAIRTYEQALTLARKEPELVAAVEKRLQLLRSRT